MIFKNKTLDFRRDQPKRTDPLRWAKDHLTLRNEAHHRGTLNCEAPAIVWHVGFWPERHNDPQDASSAETFNLRLQSWIEDRVQVFAERLLALGQPPGAERPRQFSIDRNDNRQFSFNRNDNPSGDNIWTARPKSEEFLLLWRGLKLQTRVEIHPDYAAATFFVSLGGPDTVAQNDLGSLEEGASQFADTFVQDLQAAVKNAGDDNAQAASDASHLLFHDAWQRFIFDVLDANGLSYDEVLIPGEIFVSLRGVVLELYEDISVLRAPKRSENETFDGVEAHDTLMKFEAFLSRGGFEKDDREFVAARVVQNRAIFISPFGAHSPADPRDDPNHPDPRRSTRFAILTKGKITSRQLAKAISQISDLATLQIAALKDIGLMRAVGTAIRMESDKLDIAALHVSESIIRSSPTDLAAFRLLRFASRIDEISKIPTGGLSYRIFRSSIYTSEFWKTLNQLDGRKITPFENLPDFFLARLSRVFDYIGRLSSRYQYVKDRLAEIRDHIVLNQTIDMASATWQMLKIQRSAEFLGLVLFVIGLATFFGEFAHSTYGAPVKILDTITFRDFFPLIFNLPTECAGVAEDPSRCESLIRIDGYTFGALFAGALSLVFFLGRFVRRALRGR